MPFKRLVRLLLFLLFPLVGFLAVIHPLRGLSALVLGSEKGDAVDLHLRWTEQHYFLRRINPFDVWMRSPAASRAGVAMDTGRPSDIESDLGPTDPAHPPWGYVGGLAYLWPDWPLVRSYYAGLNLLILVALAFWLYRAVRPLGKPVAWLAALGVPAMQGVCLTLEVGQYGILVTGLLAGSLLFLKRNEEILAGLFLGLALVKPTISAPFFLVFLCRRHYLACAVTLAYCGGASLVAWVVMGTSPLELLQQLHACGSSHANEGTFGIIQLVLSAGVEQRRAVLAVMAVSLALLGTILIFRGRRISLDDAFALAAIAGRFWTYHRSYDNLMLLFLVVPLVDRIRMCRSPIPATVALLLVGLSLWAPSRFIESLPVQVLQHLIWLGAAAVLVLQPPISHDAEMSNHDNNLAPFARQYATDPASVH